MFPYTTKDGYNKKYVCDGVCFELQISRDSMNKFIEKIGFLCGKHNEKIRKLKGHMFYSTHFTERVKSVESNGVKPVYDLTEPNTHSFISNSIVVSNCGEQPLLPNESCNLGSINLSKMVLTSEDGKTEIDWTKLRKTAKMAMHFLDNVIDRSQYPLQKIDMMVKGNRKIGLGVMGFADMLVQLGVPYDSEEGVATGEKIMEFIQKEATEKSVELSGKRGVFPNFRGSIYDQKDKPRVRNATLTTIAPTGTISIIAGCSSGIEPLFAISYVRNVMDNTELLEVNPLFEKIAKERGFYSDDLMKHIARKGSIQGIKEIPEEYRRVFVTAHDIAPKWHVKMQAAFQRHVDNAVSKTVNFPNYATAKDIENVYFLAYQLGCKGTTVYRDGSREGQVLNIEKVNKAPKKTEDKPAKAEMKKDEIVKVSAEFAGGCATCQI